jgi:hypothetical protein
MPPKLRRKFSGTDRSFMGECAKGINSAAGMAVAMGDSGVLGNFYWQRGPVLF